MPQFIAPLIASVGGFVGGVAGVFLIESAAFLASSVVLLGGLAYSSSQARKAKRQARDAFNAAQVDRLVNVTSSVAPRELVLGRVRKGGAVFFKASTGSEKTTFVMLVALAGHEIDAVESIYFNDELVTLDGSGNVTSAPYALSQTISATDYGTGSVQTLLGTPIGGTLTAYTGSIGGPEGDLNPVAITGAGTSWTTTAGATIQYQYSSTVAKANVRAILGTAGQAADARVQALFPGVWTTNHRARAVAYLVCEFTYDETAFATGLPVVTAVIRGAKLPDPRSGLTVWSDNPALMMRYVYTDPAFGKASITAAEDLRIIAAANACDTSQGYVVDGITTTVPLYRAGIVAPYGAAAKDLLDDLSQAMAGSWAFAGGELYLKAGVASASAMSLTDADLAVVVRNGAAEQMHPISIAVHRERAQKINTVNVQIWDAAQEYKQVSLTPLKSATLITRDGAELAQAVTFPAIGYAAQALHVAGVMMRDGRDPLTLQIPFKLRVYPVELFDTVDLTLARYGWTSKLFQVLGREWTADGFLQLTLKETAASIYAVDAAFDPQGYAANTSLPNPWYVPVVGTLTIYSGTNELWKQADGTIVSRMRVSWPAITDSSVTNGGTVEVQYRSVLSGDEWASVQIDGAQTQLVIDGVQDQVYYTVRARARNRVAVGLWNTQVTHQVIGKTAPPPNFDYFDITFSDSGRRFISFGYTPATSAPRDLAGAVIRWLPYAGGATEPAWATMSGLHDGVLTSGVDTDYGEPGDYTFAICAVDTSGLESAVPIWIQRTLPIISAGISNGLAYAFKRSASAPIWVDSATSGPGAVTWDFTLGGITTDPLLNGWTRAIPAVDGNPLYLTVASASARTPTDVIANTEWATPVQWTQDGANGLNVATAMLYQRNSSNSVGPTLPSATITYTFATGGMAGINNGWSAAVPSAGGAHLWVTLATAVSVQPAATDSITAGEWAAASLMASDGAAGATGGTGAAGTRGTIVTKIVGAFTAAAAAAQVTAIATASGATPTTPIVGDIVYYTGGAQECTVAGSPGTWAAVAAYIDGSLVATGTIAAAQLSSSVSISTDGNLEVRGGVSIPGVGTAAIRANGSNTQQLGIYATSSSSIGYAVYGEGSSNAAGLYGNASSNGTGVIAQYSGGGSGLALNAQGPSRFTGQIASTVSTGTPPLVIASTTNVPNLNASYLGGFDSTGFLRVGGTNSMSVTTQITNLNANYLQGNLASAFLGASATAADSTNLAGSPGTDYARVTSLVGTVPTANAHITIVAGGVTVRIPCAYP